MKKLLTVLLAAVISVGIFAGCGKGAKSVELKWIDNPSSKEEYMNNAKIQSLTQLGNTYRLKKAIEKAKNGEDVNIVYIGGSITEGDHLDTCYANRSYNYFKDKFGKGDGENVHYINSGISGTGSKLGALRCEADVTSHNPDIVFIEYAVNDGGDRTDFDGFECLIRDCLECESQPAVVLLFARAEGFTSQDWKKEIGKHYNVSMISYADGITYLFDNKALTWGEFSRDGLHPNADGNAVVAEFISYFFDEVDRLPGDETDLTIPDRLYDGFLEDAHLLQKTNYEHTDETMGSWRKKSSGFHYENGWTKAFDDSNDPLVFEFTGKHAYVLYPSSENEGFGVLNVKVYFNGELIDTKTFDEHVQGGWMYPTIGLLNYSAVPGDYRIEITADGDNVKCDLQVLAVAYTD